MEKKEHAIMKKNKSASIFVQESSQTTPRRTDNFKSRTKVHKQYVAHQGNLQGNYATPETIFIEPEKPIPIRLVKEDDQKAGDTHKCYEKFGGK